MQVYKVYSYYNSADTSRDPDEYHYTQHGVYSLLSKAKLKATDVMEKSRSYGKLTECDDGCFRANEFCSYGSTLVIELLEVE